MNYKLEKFWNNISEFFVGDKTLMNYKLEKFWNVEDEIYKAALNAYEL